MKLMQAEIPETDLEAELPVLEQSPVDEVMITAKKEWVRGLSLFLIFTIMWITVVYLKTISQQQDMPNNKSEVALPSPSSFEAITKEEIHYKYAVWNGSGIANYAKKVADDLTSRGIVVGEVKNAPSQIKGTTVKVVDKLESKKQIIEMDLNAVGIEVVKFEYDLDAANEYNVLVILGK